MLLTGHRDKKNVLGDHGDEELQGNEEGGDWAEGSDLDRRSSSTGGKNVLKKAMKRRATDVVLR